MGSLREFIKLAQVVQSGGVPDPYYEPEENPIARILRDRGTVPRPFDIDDYLGGRPEPRPPLEWPTEDTEDAYSISPSSSEQLRRLFNLPVQPSGNPYEQFMSKQSSLMDRFEEDEEADIEDTPLFDAVRDALDYRGKGLAWLLGTSQMPIANVPLSLLITGINRGNLTRRLKKRHKNVEDQSTIKEMSQDAYRQAYKVPRVARWFSVPGLIVSVASMPSSREKDVIVENIMEDLREDLYDMKAEKK